MAAAANQLDRRLTELSPLLQAARRPARGWIKAVREALGMTSAQLARRIGVKQPRVIELERGEIEGSVTLQSLERAAQALGCKLVYVLVPERPLSETLRDRAAALADERLEAVEHTMRLEDQSVTNRTERATMREQMIAALLRKPARLWDTP